jgi:hypothetical protein
MLSASLGRDYIMALPIDPNAADPEEVVLQAAASLDVNEGYRVHVIDGRIIVTAPADGDHAVALTTLTL